MKIPKHVVKESLDAAASISHYSSLSEFFWQATVKRGVVHFREFYHFYCN